MDRREFLRVLFSTSLVVFTGEVDAQEKGFVQPREAMNYIKLENKRVQCLNCPNHCILPPGERGICRVRENRNGKLYTLVYGNPCAVHIDPIEKKPLFHFLPGTSALSIATAGCNFRCKFCQNWQISQFPPEETENYRLSPEEVIGVYDHYSSQYPLRSIAYTYNEPTVFYEYMYDTAKIAKNEGIYNIMHSNGFMEEKPLRKLCKYLDAANIDLKYMDENLYEEVSQGHLAPVLKTLKILKEEGIHLEVTNLVVPTINNKDAIFKKMVGWIIENLGENVPLHFSRFFPTYKLENLPPTTVGDVDKARKIAQNMGMKFVYTGNVPFGHPGENTYCPHCGKILIKRYGYTLLENNIVNGKCKFCGTPIPGVWK